MSYFDTPEFSDRFNYDGPLGPECSDSGTALRIWAPTAESVTLRLFESGSPHGAGTGSGSEAMHIAEFTRGDRGVWYWSTPQNLHGVYYDLHIAAEGHDRRTADPWAKACGLNGGRSMFVNLTKTDPEGWDRDAPPERQPETVIYELHVKDFSWDAVSGVPERYRGRFKALTLEDTTLREDGRRPTCMGYLKSLGVTHIQLMPIFDYGSVDESGPRDAFNWGYDPVNYNVPEGSYSTDPSNGQVRIRELKEAVMALHKMGFRVIMDVVYNHTYRKDSWLWRTVPGYYTRTWEDGTLSNGSGCGCDLSTERYMCGRYIRDSVLYWAREYHIDGFRFDLMGLMDVELMNSIRRALDEEYGPGEKVMLGEPWSAGPTAARPGTALATKENAHLLADGIGLFCDATRDAVKGSLWRAEDRGFVNGAGLSVERLTPCLRGWANTTGGFVRNPGQTVNYLSCHDDWTLWDKLGVANGTRRLTRPNDTLIRQNKLAAAIYTMCQGTLFLLSGEEFARTKRGIKNTYKSSLRINKLNWSRCWKYEDLVNYYRGLLELRRHLPAMCDKSGAAWSRIQYTEDFGESCAAFLIDNRPNGAPNEETYWSRIILSYNAGPRPASYSLPEGNWEILVNVASSDRVKINSSLRDWATVEPVSALILGQK